MGQSGDSSFRRISLFHIDRQCLNVRIAKRGNRLVQALPMLGGWRYVHGRDLNGSWHHQSLSAVHGFNFTAGPTQVPHCPSPSVNVVKDPVAIGNLQGPALRQVAHFAVMYGKVHFGTA